MHMALGKYKNQPTLTPETSSAKSLHLTSPISQGNKWLNMVKTFRVLLNYENPESLIG